MFLSNIRDYYAAMAAALIDVELQWRLERLPEPRAQTALDKAIIAEGERRRMLGPAGEGDGHAHHETHLRAG